jgi:hypothetical protein
MKRERGPRRTHNAPLKVGVGVVDRALELFHVEFQVGLGVLDELRALGLWWEVHGRMHDARERSMRRRRDGLVKDGPIRLPGPDRRWARHGAHQFTLFFVFLLILDAGGVASVAHGVLKRINNGSDASSLRVKSGPNCFYYRKMKMQ